MLAQNLIDESDRFARRELDLKKTASFYHRNKVQIGLVAESLKKVNVLRAECTSDSFDLSITGDTHMLNATFAAFRKMGYEPDKRPEEKVATFSCYWDHPDLEARFWLYFTSTVCQRVKVGTETKEVDVYETVCE